MDELRQHLDDEARRVEAAPDALEALKRRAGRRRVTRQIGTGTLALAVAAGGFALAFAAFRDPPAGRPLVGPSGSISPTSGPTIVTVVGPGELGGEAARLADRLAAPGYNVEWIEQCSDCPVPARTIVRFTPEARGEAESIRRDFLPGAATQLISWSDKRPEIEITLGADYDLVSNSAIRVRVLDAGGGRTATDTAAGQLRGFGYNVVEVGDAPAGYDETIVACAPHQDEAGLRILAQFFPGAEFRGEIPSADHDVTVYVGPDVD